MQNKVRQSNMELLRIVAMFLVLIVHANFFTLGEPTREEMTMSFIPSFTRVFFESLSIICVNVFVLLSGWFGIHFSLKGLSKFFFQVLFYKCGVYIVGMFLGVTIFSREEVLHCLLLDGFGWFIKAYLLLFILSPVLNSFTESTPKVLFRTVLFCFFSFQTVFGFLFSESVTYFNGGYSVVSFIGLYLLARYLRRFYIDSLFKHSLNRFLSLFLLLIVTNTILLVIAKWMGKNYMFNSLWSYTNPLVILAAIVLLLSFAKIRFYSGVINKIASYSFAVYLFHTHLIVLSNYFKPLIQRIYHCSDGIFCLLLIFTILVFFYVVATIIDVLRDFCWKYILNRYNILLICKNR